jgi:hypothetical protein
MTRQTRLLRELEQLLPHGQWRVVQERPWYSLTFSGVQLTLAYTPAAPRGVDEVAAILGKHEFSLQDRIVADIGGEEAGEGLVVVMLVLEG